MSARRHIALTAPAGGGDDLQFAAVQIETRDGAIVGAETCQYPATVFVPDPTEPENVRAITVARQHRVIHATVLIDSDDLLIRWVYEDSSRGLLDQPYRPAGRPTRPGPTVRT